MKTYTTKIMGKTVAVYGKRERVMRNRFGVSLGSTFMGLHMGKTSRYLSVPALAKRTFGGVKDIQKVYWQAKGNDGNPLETIVVPCNS